jgi:acyl-coenzyme A thioesterase PaaI-like protein
LTVSLAIFEPLEAPHHWQPSALAAGPFAGLQGGAVASLLTAEIERQAEARNCGTAISVSAWFLRPTPMAELRTRLSVLTEGGRVSVVDNTLWAAGEDQPCATVRVTLSRERMVEIPGFPDEASDTRRPPPISAPHRQGCPWQALVHGRHGSARWRWHRLVPP